MKISNLFKVKTYSSQSSKVGEVSMTSTSSDEKVSKVKVGSFIVALAAILGTVGGYLTGAITLMNGITALATEIGALLAVFGIAEVPLLNTIISLFENVSTSKKK